MYNLSFIQQKYPDQYNSIKDIEYVPSNYASGKIPSNIDLKIIGKGSSLPLHAIIDRQASQNLPFILSLELENKFSRLPQKTSRVFYFTINNKHEETFMYLGKLPEKDKEKTAFLLTYFEANNGSPKAQLLLAEMYLEGRGVAINRREALRYYALSAKKGSLEALTMIALCISKGMFIEQDQKMAVDILKDLSNNFNYPEAQYQLAKHLEQGIGCEKDLNEAIRYCMLAAEKDHTGALFALVVYFTDNSYGNINYEKAADLITILIHLNFGKEFTLERINHWINQLSENLPEFFKVEVDRLHQQILSHY